MHANTCTHACTHACTQTHIYSHTRTTHYIYMYHTYHVHVPRTTYHVPRTTYHTYHVPHTLHSHTRTAHTILSSPHLHSLSRIGQNHMYTTYMTIYLVIFLPKTPYIHRIYKWFWLTLIPYPTLLTGVSCKTHQHTLTLS